MKRFHFKNNQKLDDEIMRLVEKFECNGISMLVNNILFNNNNEFLIFINHYCIQERKFHLIKSCKVNRKVSIPDSVYHSLKLCHKELDTYSIALIWRSFLIEVVNLFNSGGLHAWELFKKGVIETGQNTETNKNQENNLFLEKIDSVHITGINWKTIKKICFFNFGNEFIGYLRC